eukprot:6203701-Pleurochrysis_carterae.AAC.1
MAEKVAEERVPLAATQRAAVSALQELAAALRRRELQSTGSLTKMPRCALYVLSVFHEASE